MKYRHIIFAGLVYVLTGLILDTLRYRAGLGQQGALANIMCYPFLRLDRRLRQASDRLYNVPDCKNGTARAITPDPTADRAPSGAR